MGPLSGYGGRVVNQTATPGRVCARPGFHLTDEQAQAVYEVALTLPEEERTAERMVELARDEDSPIHGLLTWNDAEAAEQYRLTQMRYALRAVVFEVEINEQAEHLPVFFSVQIDDSRQHTYAQRSFVVSEDARRQKVIDGALRDLRAFQRRYRMHRDLLEAELPELGAVFDI